MGEIEKRHSAGLVVTIFAAGLAWSVAAQDGPAPPVQPSRSEQAAPERLDALFKELGEPGRADWQQIQTEINRIWSRSGSPAMDLLLRRGEAATEAGDYEAAIDHLSALIDHAPDFAEGWNARATAYYLMGEYSLSIADIEHVLALNPRHFGALAGLGAMLEEMGQPRLALKALERVEEMNPNQPDIGEAVKRLRRMAGTADL